MKSVLLVVCALGFGFLPAIGDLRYATLFTLFMPILLGLIHFVLHRHDWPARLVPWLFASIAIGRVAGYGWLNSRQGRLGPLVDQDVWFFGGLAAISFAFAWWGWLRDLTETRAEANPKST
jgi:hypothetical protein